MSIIELNDSNFYKEAIDSETPSVILISKGRESEAYSLLEELSSEYGDCIKFFFLDAEKNTTHQDLGIDTFPAIVYFRETMEVERHLRIPGKEEIEEILKKLCKR